MSLKFYADSNILVIGSSGTGKTTAVLRIIKERLIEPFPKKILYLYGAHQAFMTSWNKDKTNPRISFVKGLDMTVVDKQKEPALLIVDDLILELNKDLAQHFIAGSHHKNITTIFITHSLFLNNEHYRLISNNSQYIMLFKNKRNYSQVATLGRQILGQDQHRLLEAYKYIRPFQFVLFSFHPLVPEELLIIADFFESCPSVFI